MSQWRGYQGRGRGGYAPRARGTFQPRGGFSPTEPKPQANFLQGLYRNSLQTVPKPTISDIASLDIEIRDPTYLGSYNWVGNDVKPTILVPGSPPIWRERPFPYTVEPDVGIHYVDQNGYRLPSQRLLPLFRAVDIMSEDKVDWSTVDFVTDRNGLRNLLRWVNYDGEESMREFRIDTQLVGKRTVLFNRWAPSNTENFLGFTFGFNFEKESTRPAPGCEGSSSHHRIIQYELDGITLVVRFEVDACVADTKALKSADDVDDLSSLLSGLAVSSTPSRTSASRGSQPSTISDGLKVIRGGSEIAQEDIAELTTRSERNAANYDWTETFPQLYLSQTSHLYLAVHNRGRFLRVEKEKLGSRRLTMVEEDLKVNLKKLRASLESIQDIVLDKGNDGRLSFVCREGVLKVYERESRASCLPESVLARFDE